MVRQAVPGRFDGLKPIGHFMALKRLTAPVPGRFIQAITREKNQYVVIANIHTQAQNEIIIYDAINDNVAGPFYDLLNKIDGE